MASKAPTQFAFVPTDDFGRPKDKDRKLIRSHCMKGKNKKVDVTVKRPGRPHPAKAPKTSPRPRETQVLTPESSSEEASQDNEPLDADSTAPLADITLESEWNDANAVDVSVASDAIGPITPRSSPSPRLPDCVLGVRFASDLDYHSRELLFTYFNISRYSFFPIQFCKDTDSSKQTWFSWLFSDAAYVDSLVLGLTVMEDILRYKTLKVKTRALMKSAISRVNEHLADSLTSLQDSTVATIVVLLSLAESLGEEESAKAHVGGLRQMILLRGGLGAFEGNVKLYIKLGLIDLSFSVHTGEPPQFFRDPISWDPIFDPRTLSPAPGGIENTGRDYMSSYLHALVDPRLMIIFQDLQSFADLLNAAAADSDLRIPDIEFQNIKNSIQYRLLRLQHKLHDILGECLRLALLAYLTSIFHIPGHLPLYPRYRYLEDRFRDCARALEAATPQLRQLIMWILMVGAVSVCQDEDQVWLRAKWQADVVPALSWPEVRERLADIMWIHVLHDVPGHASFEVLSAQDNV